MKQKEFKEKMPVMAEFVDQLVAAFGKESIHGQIRKGLQGEPVFWATENGHEIGTRVDSGAKWKVMWDEKGIAYSVEIKRGNHEE